MSSGGVVVFDLETTFDGPNRCSILQIAAQSIPADTRVLGARFDTFVNPHRAFDPRTAELCKIKESDLASAPDTRFALQSFLAFLREAHQTQAAEAAAQRRAVLAREVVAPDMDQEASHGLVLLAHNGRAFDFRVLLREMRACGLDFRSAGLADIRFGDSKDVFFRHPLAAMVGRVTHRAWSLGHVYATALGREMTDAHDARGDVRGLCEILALYPDAPRMLGGVAFAARAWVHVANNPDLRVLFALGAPVKCTVCASPQERDAHAVHSPYWCALHRHRRPDAQPGARVDLTPSLRRLRALLCTG